MKKWIVLYFVIVLAVLGINANRHTDNWEKTAVVVSGTVANVKTFPAFRRGTRYAEVISFEWNGTERHFISQMHSRLYPKLGRTRDVLVNPNNPNQVRERRSAAWELLIPKVIKDNPKLGKIWLAGCLLFAVGWFGCWRNYEFFRRAITVPGKVISFSKGKTSRGTPVYYEEIVFEFAGQQHKVLSEKSRLWKSNVGAIRKVGIDPDQKDHFRVKEPMWVQKIILVVGLVALLISIWM